MKEKFKFMLRFIAWFVICFLVIYFIVLFFGSKLFGSGDPILMEVGAAFILSVFVFSGNEAVTQLEKRVKALEERIRELEEKE